MRIEVYQLLKNFQNQFAQSLALRGGPFSFTVFRVNSVRLALAGLLLIASFGAVQAATPVITAPATQNVERETYLVFNGTNGNRISIADGDNHNQTVTITVTNGSFFLEDVTGLTPVAPATFTGTGQQEITSGTAVSFSGSLANVNAALSESSFYPTNGYAGSASVQIATNDGAGGNDSETINITVLAGTDTDGDGIYDHKDLDDDNDGIPDNVENPCEKTFAFNLSSEGWFTINRNDINNSASNGPETPASHSTDARTQNVNDPDGEGGLPGCAINNTGRANKNIAGASPTRTHYIVDADDSGGDMYIRSPDLGGIDYSTLLNGTFQYDAYNYRVGAVGPPINNGNTNQSWSNGGQATVFIYDTNGNHVRAQITISPTHKNRWENGLWNTFSFPLTSSGNVWQEGTLSTVLSSVSYISIRMEFIYGGNTNECDDVEYYAMDNVVLTSQASCDDDLDNDGIPNYLDLDSDGDGTFDADEAGHGQPHTNGVVNGPVGTDGIPDAVQGPGNGNSGGAQYPPILDLDGDDNSGATNANYQATFTEDGGAIAIADTDATLYDGNDTDNLASLTVVLTNRPDGTAETLSVNGSLLGGITAGAYDPSSGTLTLSGNASVANYLDALKKIVYNNSSQSPDGTATRSVTVVVNDGKADSNTGTTTISVTPVNDPPTAVNKTLTTDEDVPKVIETTDLGYNDLESDPLTKITLTAVPDPTEGVLFVDENKNGSLDNGEVALVINNEITKAQLDDDKLTFAPVENTSGTAHTNFAFKVNDGTDDADDANTITFDVNAINDAPVVSVPDAAANPQSTDEDIPLTFAAANLISIGDVDGDDQAVTITVIGGFFDLSGTAGLTGLGGDGTDALSFGGSLADINAALANATFTPNAAFSGAASVEVTTNDGTAIDTETINITVNPVNDAPVNALPTAQSVDEEAILTLSGANAISVSDDAGTDPVKVTLSATNGTINIPADPDNIVTDNGTASVILTGTVAQINAALDGLEYTGNLNYAGAEELTVTTDDQGNSGSGGVKTDEDKLVITVNPVNDAPTAANQTLTTDEDVVKVIATTDLGYNDPESDPLSKITLTTVPDPAKGILFVDEDKSGALDNGEVALAINDEVTKARLDDDKLTFAPAENTFTIGNPHASFAFKVNDGTDDADNANTITFEVNPVNDAPVVSVPDAVANPQSTDEDTPLTFATANLISISDVDDDNQTVTITVTDGTFKLSGDSGLTGLTGDGTGTISFAGSPADINNALANATFTPDAEFSGVASVEVTTNDGTAADTETINITVNPVNDAPVVSVPDATTNPQSTDEDTPLTFATATNPISISDADGDDQTVTITVTGGTLTLSGTPNITAGSNGSGTITLYRHPHRGEQCPGRRHLHPDG